MVEIVKVDDAELQDQFLQLPAKIYRANDFWIPANFERERALAGFSSHPFYENAEACGFLAIKESKILGRILAIDNLSCRSWRKDSIGYFGFFESFDDQETANRLFQSALEWLRDRSLTKVIGPFNPSINYSCGCLANSFDVVPTIGMPYNPQYYVSLFQGFGFSKAKDLFSFSGNMSMLDQLNPKVIRVANEAQKRLGVEIRTFDSDDSEQDFETFFEIFNSVITRQYCAHPLSRAEVEKFTNDTLPILVTDFTALAEVDGTVIGGTLVIPDMNSVAPDDAEVNRIGRTSTTRTSATQAWVSHLRRVRNILGVIRPEYQKWGIGPLMNKFMFEQFWANQSKYPKLSEVEFSWVLEDNVLSKGSIERGGAKHTKTHRLFEMLL